MIRTPATGTGPLRILHVVGRMHLGGIETWLMHVMRHTDQTRFRMDFLVHDPQPGAYDDEVRALGGTIMHCIAPTKRPWAYAGGLLRVLRNHGPYDVVHSHVHHFSGYVLRVAQQAGVPGRIAHSHNDTSAVSTQARTLRRWYFGLMTRLIARHATAGLACSRSAAVDLFGPGWGADLRWSVLPYGIEMAPFRQHVDRAAVRAELTLPQDAFVLGHVGRHVDQKNPDFLLEVAAEVVRREPKTRLLLIGDGPLRPALERKAAQTGLAAHVVFAGNRTDVPRVMLGAMDVFLFPSRYEGLGLALIEAQAAGLPCVYSDAVPQEADVVRGLTQRLALTQPASVWADAVIASRAAGTVVAPIDALDTVETSPFNIETSATQLEAVYTRRTVEET